MLWRLTHRSKIHKFLTKKDDTWAVVTGSTDGIGKCTAEELLQAGFNVVIHGRSPEKTTKVVEEFRSKFPNRKLDSAIADLTRVEDVKNIVNAMQDKHVTVFFNNAAITKLTYCLYDDFTEDQITTTLTSGIEFITRLLRQVLPLLMKNAPSLLVNIGSAAASNPIPFISTYSATKGYILSLSKSMAMEQRMTKSQVEIMYAEVHNCNSGSNKTKPAMGCPTSPVMAKAIVKAVGCGKAVVAPYWVHEFHNMMLPLIPMGIYDSVVIATVNSTMEAGNPEQYKQVTEARARGRWKK